MHLLNLIQICFSILAWKSDGYVLLAANLDDFRSIAKQFVPEKLAEQLVEMAGDTNNGNETPVPKNVKSGEVYYADTVEKSVETYEIHSESINNQRREKVKQHESEVKQRDGEGNNYNDEVIKRDFEVKKPIDEAKKHDDDVRKSTINKDMSNINMDDLVEKVKERLERDYKLKLSNTNTKSPNSKYVSDKKTGKKYVKNDSGSREEPVYDDGKPIKHIDSTQYVASARYTRQPEYIPTTNKYTVTTRGSGRGIPSRMPVHQGNTHNEYEVEEKEANYDEAAYKEVTDDAPKLFDAVDMLKSNDSYEDYVTPKKYQIYESKETSKYSKRFNVKAKTDAMEKPTEGQKRNDKAKPTDYDYEVTPGEIKARTEDLMFEEKDIHREVRNATSKNDPKGVTKKPKSGTMIPTREYYKMSSPNYYAKLPIIAEKYDFNEPIPERDREREDLRSIGNPPASINRKVKLL